MNDKYTLIRNRLRDIIGIAQDSTHFVNIVIRRNGMDIQLDYDWFRELMLKTGSDAAKKRIKYTVR